MSDSYRDNRELSWLKFNARVMEEAEDVSNPFCERLSFASIYQSNLDEFFGVRVGSLYDQTLVSPDMRDKNTNMTSKEQIDAVFNQIRLETKRRDNVWYALDEGLNEHGIYIVKFDDLTKDEVRAMDTYFEKEIWPLLVPQVVGKKQPFPFLKEKAIYAAVVLGAKKGDKKGEKLGIVPCSIDVLSRLVPVPGSEGRYLLMEDAIVHYLPKVFSHFEIRSKVLFRIIRNADIDPDEDVYDDNTDFRQVMEQLVNRRKRLSPIMLDYAEFSKDDSALSMICKHLGLKKNSTFCSEAPLDFSIFSILRDKLRGEKDLFYEKYTPRLQDGIDMKGSIIEQVEEKDRLLFFPFESIDPFLKLLNDAAVDPNVVSIQMTLYRVASNSKVIDALIRAAENEKDVRVLLELRARFDEANNISWSRRLEEAGCTILYGLDDLKVHAKLCLITRTCEDGIRYISQVGTGNYNEKTAGLYTDLSLMTADQEIGAEIADVFTHLFFDEVVEQIDSLMIAPKCLRNKVLDRIDIQIERAKEGKSAYVGAKMNSLTDKVIIDRLIEASQAGVRVELCIRGACCLVAGVPGYTDNIKVISIVGRYLEHSRISIFGDEDPEIYIGSADYMTRNTTRRVEAAAPVWDPDLKNRVLDIFRIIMEDNVKARVQQPDGTYIRSIPDGEPRNSQEIFMQK